MKTIVVKWVAEDSFYKKCMIVVESSHNAISCDLLPTESPGPHIQGDLRDHDWS